MKSYYYNFIFENNENAIKMYLWMTKFYYIKVIIFVSSLYFKFSNLCDKPFLLYSARSLKPLPAKYISFR